MAGRARRSRPSRIMFARRGPLHFRRAALRAVRKTAGRGLVPGWGGLAPGVKVPGGARRRRERSRQPSRLSSSVPSHFRRIDSTRKSIHGYCHQRRLCCRSTTSMCSRGCCHKPVGVGFVGRLDSGANDYHGLSFGPRDDSVEAAEARRKRQTGALVRCVEIEVGTDPRRVATTRWARRGPDEPARSSRSSS